MKTILSKKTAELVLLIFFSLSMVILTSPRFSSRFMRQTSDSVFIGMPGYFEDYYYYLDQFYQGKEGKWLTENRFSIERFPSTLIYFNHLLMGRIGGLLGWESYQSLNYFGLLFKFLFIGASYLLLVRYINIPVKQRIIAFLLFLFSSSFPSFIIKQGSLVLTESVDIWRTSNRILSRFGTSPPNYALVNFLFICLLIILLGIFQSEFTAISKSKNKSLKLDAVLGSLMLIIFVSSAYIFLALGDLVVSFILLATCISLLFIRKIPLTKFSVMPVSKTIVMLFFFIFIITGLTMLRSVAFDPVYKQANNWDIYQYHQQIKTIGIVKFIKGFGLLLPLFLGGLGLLLRRKNRSVYDDSAIVIVSLGWSGYLIPLLFRLPIPGFRFLFPAVYIFMGVMGMYALIAIARRIRLTYALPLLVVLYVCMNLLSFYPGWAIAVRPVPEPDYHFAYIPDNLYQGLVFLRTAEPVDSNVLASPATAIDLMIPGISGRYVYTGHFLTTYNSKEKDIQANEFMFAQKESLMAQNFLKENNIGFIVATKYVGASRETLKTKYPFLKKVFENPMVTIFQYDPEDIN
ncbi:hypothetical protein A3D03_00845 [Candidatus Gottesmanbacteria bacterium RIFCSPHIGHO2_02_FULL_40_13]|uniref:Glycosyltransferase RgtA/B/C/D-like domain-containing protein n=1 Tax=Candidatus Gottesmanbacteria bacterium RIFCSPHIGHO2_02_FULL_40_13 TaxID=1798384 RepID=A0A1F6A7V1_9BACT|nr:MAG: hypothetical protein A3D03_00845 [Candidatus Gottesmanbacteria bacterium RIFCSPHIGHO2_02_FULL_40_13]